MKKLVQITIQWYKRRKAQGVDSMSEIIGVFKDLLSQNGTKREKLCYYSCILIFFYHLYTKYQHISLTFNETETAILQAILGTVFMSYIGVTIICLLLALGKAGLIKLNANPFNIIIVVYIMLLDIGETYVSEITQIVIVLSVFSFLFAAPNADFIIALRIICLCWAIIIHFSAAIEERRERMRLNRVLDPNREGNKAWRYNDDIDDN